MKSEQEGNYNWNRKNKEEENKRIRSRVLQEGLFRETKNERHRLIYGEHLRELLNEMMN
jgi:hypothetical protein